LIDLSILIASYENEDLLAACLLALEQAHATHPRIQLEVIVIDNGSQDASVARARASGLPIRAIALSRNRGFATAVNLGLRIRRGRHVLLLNSDATVAPDVLAQGVALLDGNEAIGVVGVALLHPDGRRQRSVHAFPGLATELLPDALVRMGRRVLRGRPAPLMPGCVDVEAVRGAVMFVRGHVLDELGELDEGYFFFLEETDFCWRVRAAGHRVVYAPALQAIHRLGASSKARVPRATRIEYERSLDRFVSIRRGRRTARAVRTLRCARWIAVLLPLVLAAAIGPHGRRRLRERGGLILWHLRGRPPEPILAVALAREVDRSRAGAAPEASVEARLVDQ